MLLRSEPFDRQIPSGSRGWRILYSTTRADGSVGLASGLVVLPETVTATSPGVNLRGDAPSVIPVLAWAHGTTGYAQQCAPSLLPEPFTAGAMPVLEEVLERGWAVVATDYAGLGTDGPQPYLIGAGEAHSVLDAVRAARQLPQQPQTPTLSEQTVLWGHSQGGHAALWTGLLQGGYAPDVPLLGVAAMAPAADAIAITERLPQITGGSVFAAFVAQAYSQTYPDIELNDYVQPTGRTLVREMATRCLSEPGVLVSVLTALSVSREQSIFATDPTTGPMGQRLRENVPMGAFPMPLVIAQGEADSLIGLEQQDEYVQRLCQEGAELDYRTYPGLDHMG